jgi:integrase
MEKQRPPIKWIKAAPGIRYYEHSTRNEDGETKEDWEQRQRKGKWNPKPDRYWQIFFKRDKKNHYEGLGWSSRGWNLDKARGKFAKFYSNAKEGTGPTSTKEQREIKRKEEKAALASQEQERLRLEREEKENVLFSILIDNYVDWASKNKKKSHRMDESRCRVHIKPALGHLRARDIDAAVLVGFKEDLMGRQALLTKKKRPNVEGASAERSLRTLSTATMRHCLVLIRQIFNHNIAMGDFIGTNPLAKGNIPKSLKEGLIPNEIDNQRDRFFSKAEADSLLQELKQRSQQTHDIALVSLRSGARFDEIVSLEWQHIDFPNGNIYIKESKNGNSRHAFMTPDVRAALLFWNTGKPNDLVFKSKKGRKIGQISSAFWRAVGVLKLNEGITDPKQKIVFYSFRHTFASWLAQQGTPIFTIKELMGHKKIEMTMRYAHLLPDTKKEAVMQMFNEYASDKVIRMADRR